MKSTICAVAAAMLAPAAMAQTAPAPAPAPNAAPSAAGTYTPEEISKFAKAALAVNKIQADATTPATDKQAKMAAAVTAQGLDPAKFNEIGKAVQSDPALMKQVQTAMAAAQSDAGAPSPTPTSFY